MSTSSLPPATPEIPDHELLGRIGGGSYGEVWLARSATGVHRAVKILHRSRFGDDQQPFEREFEGLMRFEPVSRQHEHVVDILHIGRGEELLYYVMELADGSDGENALEEELDAASYLPDTLSGRIRRLGRLPMHECLEVARALSLALEHLHSNGLIHRDVKPSNVVFVDGVLKLADVGLVSAPDTTFSLVGTEGYIPPEGPGTVQADLYGLGKILYEISSGLDRMDFPTVPAWVCDEPNPGRWSEFNEIVLKCCGQDSEIRYASARDVLEDLALLERGGSLVKKRRARKLWRGMKAGVVVTTLAGGLVGLGALLTQWAPKELRLSREIGLGGLDLPVMAHRHREWEISPDGRVIAFTHESSIWLRDETSRILRPAVQDPEDWILSNPRWLGDPAHPGHLLCLGTRLGPEGPVSAVLVIDTVARKIDSAVYTTRHMLNGMSVSHAARKVAVRVLGDDSEQGLLGIDLDDHSVEVWDQFERQRVGTFSPDGKWLTIAVADPGKGGKDEWSLWLRATSGDKLVRITDGSALARHPAWSRDGESLFYVSGERFEDDVAVGLWKVKIDADSGRPLRTPREVMRREHSQILFPQLVADTGEMALVVSTNSTNLHVAPAANLRDAEHLATGSNAKLSQDGSWFFYEDHRSGREGLYRQSASGTEPQGPELLTTELPLSFDIDPSAQSVVAATQVGTRAGTRVEIVVRDVSGGASRVLTSISGERGVSVRWSPDGELIAYTDGPRLFVIEAAGGSPRLLGTIEDWDEMVWEGKLAWSPDSSRIAAFGYPDKEALENENNHVFVTDLSTGNLLSITDHPTDAYYKEGLRWHPDGDRLTYMIYGPGRRDAQIRQGYPDGRATTLLVDQEDHWDWVGTWHPDGNEFYFASFGGDSHENSTHVLHLSSNEITHPESPFRAGKHLPQWSADGQVVLWGVNATFSRLWMLEEK